MDVRILDRCLASPETASSLVRLEKPFIIEKDMSTLKTSALQHKSAHLVASIPTVTWTRLWDMALDRGSFGTSHLQRLVCQLARPTFEGQMCSLCQQTVDPTNS